MDSEGCPDGFASDRVFQKTPAILCATNLTVFWCISLMICLARLIAFLTKLRHYFYAPSLLKSRRRSQFTLLVSLNSVSCYFLLTVLASLNLANAANGWSFALYSITYLSLITDLTMMLFKIVRLGKGVINLPQKEMLLGEVDYLSRFTTIGVLMAMVQILMALVSTVTLIILSPIMPQNDFLLGVIGFSSKAVFQLLCSLGMALVRLSHSNTISNCDN